MTAWSYAKNKLVPSDQCHITVTDDELGSFRGLRVFSTAVAVNQTMFKLDHHIDRIITAATAILIPPSLSRDAIKTAIHDTLAANSHDMIMIRLLLSGYQADDHMASHFYMYTSPVPVYSSDLYRNGATLGTYTHDRELASIKLTHYVSAYLAKAKLGNSVDYPLYISSDDRPQIREGDTYNIVFIRDNTLVTPKADGSILNGITRQCLTDIAASLKLDYREQTVYYDDLDQYSGCFITTSLRFIMPIRSINTLDFTVPHPIIHRIQAAFQQLFKSETGHHLSQLDPI